MMIDGQGMEPQEATVRVQVVYYLSRAGQLQHPHLIDVAISPNSNGLYLRDVKQRLTAIRGKGVADSFSWSCKRNYKDNFIWQDLSDDDKILPLGDGEFVLKGSGLYAGYRAPGKSNFMDGQIDPESTSLSPKQESVKGHNRVDQKKFDFDAVKRSLDPQIEHLQDQSDLAAALSLSLQLMTNPHAHLKRFSKDKSMDLNQQVMNSLSQAKAGPAEECTLDRYDMSSNETFLSEESSTQNTFRESSVSARECHQSTSSSSTRTQDLNYDPPVAKQCQTKERPISADDGPKVSKASSVATGRQEKPDELPPIKTKFKASVAQEVGDSATFMLSPKRIMAALSSTPDKKLGKILHSSSVRSSTLSNSASSHAAVEPMSAMKLSNKATCLSQLRFCSQLSPHATDSRPDSPVRPANTISALVQSSTPTQAPSSTARTQSGPYWTRWKPGRRSRTSESKVVAEEPSTPSLKAEFALPADQTSTTVRRALNASFEFDMAADVSSSDSGPGTPQLPAGLTNTRSNESSNLPSQPRKSITFLTDTSVTAGSHLGLNMSSENSNAEVMTPISVKEVITERLPVQQSAPGLGQNYLGGTAVKEIVLPQTPKHMKTDGGQSFDSMDNANYLSPSFSSSDSIPGAGLPVNAALPESPESPLKQNPPCSPIRTNSPPARTNSLAERPLTSPGSFNKRTENGRARARGLVKEVTSKDSKLMKDLAKEMERSKASSGTMRSIASSKRVSGIKNGNTTGGAKSVMSSAANRSPPRISSLLWEEPPHTPKKNVNVINRDERPLTAGRSNLDWEKTLQEAASFSLPPPDFGQILQECGQCGRTFKPDSLKVHMRGCHGVRRSQDSEIPIYGANLTSMRVRQ